MSAAVLMALVLVSSASLLSVGGTGGVVSRAMAGEAHVAIAIFGDAEFAALAMDEGWPGAGTPEDPYIIQGLDIATADSYAISVSSTNVSFVVTGCSLVGSFGAVHLTEVRNCTFHGNELLGAHYAVIMSGSDAVTVTNNTCSVTTTGLSLSECHGAVVANNTISMELGLGIQISDCVNATIRANAMAGCGIVIHPWHLENDVSHVITSDNTVGGRPVYYFSGEEGAAVPQDGGQVILAGCANMTLTGMSFADASVGLSIYFSSNITVSDVTSTGHQWCGVDIEYCDGVSFEGCDFSGMHNNGVRVTRCTNTTVLGCTVSDNHMGVIVYMSDSTTLAENSLSCNDYGFFIEYSTDCTVSANTLEECDITILGHDIECWNTHSIDPDNTVNGAPVAYLRDQAGGEVPPGTGELILANCSDMEVAGATLTSGMQTAVLMGYCTNVTFSGCTFEDNSMGVFMQGCVGCTFSDNSFLGSGTGVYSQFSKWNNYTGNEFADGYVGIDLDYDSNSNTVRGNDFLYQSSYAVLVERWSTGNTLHGNTFIGNNGASGDHAGSDAQSYDECAGNMWDLDGRGNYWSDWTSPDQDIDGVVDAPYELSPAGCAYDLFPLTAPPTFEDDWELGFLSLSISAERTAFGLGEEVDFAVGVSNSAQIGVTLVFLDTQIIDFWVEDSEGTVVFEYTPPVFFVITQVTVGPGETLTYGLTWDQAADGRIPECGDYTIFAQVCGYDIEELGAEATVMVDEDKPVTDLLLQGDMGEEGWFVSQVNVTLEPVDNTSGVASTQCRVDGSDWFEYEGTFAISEDGAHSVEYFSTDNAGNAEDVVSAEVKVDSTAPSLDILTEDGLVLHEEDLYYGGVNISWTGTDDCSWIDHYAWSLDGGSLQEVEPSGVPDNIYTWRFVGLDNGSHTMTVYAYDRAGNMASESVSFTLVLEEEEPETGTDETEDEGLPSWALPVAVGAAAAVAVGAAAFLLRRPSLPPKA